MSSLDARYGLVQEGSSAGLSSFLSACIEARRWEKANIPFASPQIAYDIALFAAVSRLGNQRVASKSVHLALGYSPDRVREVLVALEADGWISKLPHQGDGRMRLIHATEKLMLLMQEYGKHRQSRPEPVVSNLRHAG